MTAPVLVAVAHGSRDPRSSTTVRALVDLVRERAPGTDVRPAFLDFDHPGLTDVLAGLGDRPAVVVPLLLGSAYHARVDIPAIVAATRPDVPVADVLGPDPALLDVAAERLGELGLTPGDPGLGIVLAATGSTHAAANEVVHRLAARWPGTLAGFATATPGIGHAVARLRAQGAERIAVASWFLAPGRLLDRVHEQAGAPVAEALGAHPAIADLVITRYRRALTSHLLRAA
ncbi:sirohydrochlorin chelatase [Pseudonocardia ailaonensis]|uniref:Sirohydrochlorin chelatase n=1 Tax=Pseudonocardia ailaonensis TaxID=367279 RepID=A0ABN2N1H2_9PSEU